MNNILNYLGDCLIKVEEQKDSPKLLAQTLAKWWVLRNLANHRVTRCSTRTGLMVNLPKYEPWEIAAIHDTTKHIKQTVEKMNDLSRRKLRYFIHQNAGHTKTGILFNQFGLA